MATTQADPPSTKRRRRAGEALDRTAPVHKQGAGALGISRQRWSQMVRGTYPKVDVAYEVAERLAICERTNPTPLGSDLVSYGVEVALGDLETAALLRELSVRIEALRDGAEAALEVAGIMTLLAERGIEPTTD